MPTTKTELPKDNGMAKMMMETINNMLIEMYASFAQAELEKKGEETKKKVLHLKKPEVNGKIMEDQEHWILMNLVNIIN